MSTNNAHDFIPTGMNHGDFFIGCVFVTGAGAWRCTDVDTRVIVAIRIDGDVLIQLIELLHSISKLIAIDE